MIGNLALAAAASLGISFGENRPTFQRMGPRPDSYYETKKPMSKRAKRRARGKAHAS